VAAVREKVGPAIEIMLEMHGRFSPAEASRVAEMVAPYHPAWIEEPVPPENPAALRRVRAATNLPIATGERLHAIQEFRELFETGCIDIVQADLTHFGGFLPMKRLAGWADAYYLPMAPHNVGGPVATMANVHFAVATSNYKVLEHFNDFADPWVQDLVDAPPRVAVDDGCFALPTRPGLGVTLNHKACAAHPRTGGRLKLFEKGWEKRGSSE
jgi:galactonate dehydratase